MCNKFEVHTFGTLFINDEPKSMNDPRYCKSDTSFAINDTVEGAELAWIYIQELGIYISSAPIVQSISWKRLQDEGYVDGKIICIDGKKYLCRLPKGGCMPNTANEWDRILQIMDGFHSCLDKHFCPFWCQESMEKEGNSHVVRSSYRDAHSLKAWYFRSDSYDGIGFRPVLEPIVGSGETKMTFHNALLMLEIMATNLTGEAASMSGTQAEYMFRKIAAIDAAMEALRNSQRESDPWVRMSEKMPEEGKRALFWLGKINMYGDQNLLFALDSVRSDEVQNWLDTATHWIELPKPPKN